MMLVVTVVLGLVMVAAVALVATQLLDIHLPP